jgi:hypothetical protein
MHIIKCENCCTDLPLDETDVIKLQAGTHYQERKHCCPHCHTVLWLEVTMAGEHSAAFPTLTPIEV